jgi:dihydroorotase
MLGLQHALRIVQLTLVDTGLIGWEDAARIMSTAPARIGSVADQGQPIAVGSPANLTLYDPAAESTVTADEIVSISDNSPYLGMSLPGSVRDVLFRGRPTVRDGVLQDLNGPAAPTPSSPTASASEGAHA